MLLGRDDAGSSRQGQQCSRLCCFWLGVETICPFAESARSVRRSRRRTMPGVSGRSGLVGGSEKSSTYSQAQNPYPSSGGI